ncbi:odorant receptor 4-like [Anticarsia gemmatalis]|uniref:odorant receptor 4-like n=1 Tax=Anticarsia gemmatalis TaxID=129554 RepID=UPI003F76E9BF
MSSDEKSVALKEIHTTLNLCNFCIRRVGLSFIDETPKTFYEKLSKNLALIISSSLLVLMLAGEIAYVSGQLINISSVEEFVGSYLHIAGYDTLSFGKLLTIWYKRHTFRQLMSELAEIWPVSIKNAEAEIKYNSLSALKHRQNLYAFWNILGVWFYNLTPIALLIYRKARGVPAALGYVWQMYYPFDKTQLLPHIAVYIFETLAGLTSVCCMLGSDLLFMTMASHISMLLRLLQEQIRRLGAGDSSTSVSKPVDCYKDIVAVVKIHQRLISYINDLESAFSVINLINVLLSSVNICFVMFAIVFLDSWMELSNKFYLGAVLTQMGIVCWYADDIYRASVGVADAVYESGWYKSNTQSRRAMLVVLQRSQKPLYFTALKFRAITMTTYSSILTTAYSYFTLLYTSYRRD